MASKKESKVVPSKEEIEKKALSDAKLQEFYISAEKALRRFYYYSKAFPNSKVSKLTVDVSGDPNRDTAWWNLQDKSITFSRSLLEAFDFREDLLEFVINHETGHSSFTKYWLEPAEMNWASNMIMNHLEDWRLNTFLVTQFPHLTPYTRDCYAALDSMRQTSSAKRKALDLETLKKLPKEVQEKMKKAIEQEDKPTTEASLGFVINFWSGIGARTAYSNFPTQLDAYIAGRGLSPAQAELVEKLKPHMLAFQAQQPTFFDDKGNSQKSLVALFHCREILRILNEADLMPKQLTLEAFLKAIKDELEKRKKDKADKGKGQPQEGKGDQEGEGASGGEGEGEGEGKGKGKGKGKGSSGEPGEGDASGEGSSGGEDYRQSESKSGSGKGGSGPSKSGEESSKEAGNGDGSSKDASTKEESGKDAAGKESSKSDGSNPSDKSEGTGDGAGSGSGSGKSGGKGSSKGGVDSETKKELEEMSTEELEKLKDSLEKARATGGKDGTEGKPQDAKSGSAEEAKAAKDASDAMGSAAEHTTEKGNESGPKSTNAGGDTPFLPFEGYVAPKDLSSYNAFMAIWSTQIARIAKTFANAKAKSHMEQGHKSSPKSVGHRLRIRSVVRQIASPRADAKIFYSRTGEMTPGHARHNFEDILIGLDCSGSMSTAAPMMRNLVGLTYLALRKSKTRCAICATDCDTPTLVGQGQKLERPEPVIAKLKELRVNGDVDMANGSVQVLRKIQNKGSTPENSRLIIFSDCCAHDHDAKSVAREAEAIGYPVCIVVIGSNDHYLDNVMRLMPKSSFITIPHQMNEKELLQFMKVFATWMANPPGFYQKAKAQHKGVVNGLKGISGVIEE